MNFYFGCYERTGHFLFNENMEIITEFGIKSVQMEELLKCLAKEGISFRDIDGYFCPKSNQEGAYATWRKESVPWTILSILDNSVDKRIGSHSTFIIHGYWESSDCLIEKAKELFPQIFKRIFDKINRNYLTEEVVNASGG